MTLDDALAALNARVEPGRAAQMKAYHKVDRPYLGIGNGPLDDLARAWRQGLTLDARVDLAQALWSTNIYEARVLAAKLLTQARINPDQRVWDLIKGWVPDFDSWAIADHVAMAGQRRLTADPRRVDEVEAWTTSDHMWSKRAALVMTLRFGRDRNPTPEEAAIRARVLNWAAAYVADPDWFIQKAVAWWLRDLSKRDPQQVARFLADHGDRMKPFARKIAAKYL